MTDDKHLKLVEMKDKKILFGLGFRMCQWILAFDFLPMMKSWPLFSTLLELTTQKRYAAERLRRKTI